MSRAAEIVREIAAEERARRTRRKPRMVPATPGMVEHAEEAARRYRAWRVASDACEAARGTDRSALAPMDLLREEELLYQHYTDACATVFHFVAGALEIDLSAEVRA